MVKAVEKREKSCLIVLMVLALLFLAAAPAVSHAMELSAAETADSVRVFPQGSTVKSLGRTLIPQNSGATLQVRAPDGTPRSREVFTGDTARILDRSGGVVDTFTIVLEGDALPVSSAGPSSQPESSSEPAPSSQPGSSSEPGSSSQGSSAPEPSESAGPLPVPDEGGLLVFFPSPVTVEGLADELYAPGQYRPEELRFSVRSAAGSARENGSVCTGDAIRVLDGGGKFLYQSTAVVAGDLTRCGRATPQACSLLYDYLARKADLREDQLDAADLDRDGRVGTGDLLRLKKAAAASAGH